MTTREQIKSWFKRGYYPKSEHFHTWIDSFFHKNDKIPIHAVDELSTHLNGKFPLTDGQQLENRINTLGTEVFQHRQATINEFNRVDDQIDEIITTTDEINQRLYEHEETDRENFEKVDDQLESLRNGVEGNKKGIEGLRQSDLQFSKDMQDHESISNQQFDAIQNTLSFLSTENNQLRERFELLEMGSRYVKQDEKGMPNGIATLNPVGKVPVSQIPKDLKILLVDSYMSDSSEYATTAAAVYRLYQYFQADRREVQHEIAALEDLLKNSRELGVSPQSVFVSGLAQEQIIYVKTSGTWTVDNLPDWISANTNGTGNGMVLLLFLANDSDEERTGTITIVNQYGASEEVSITQEARVISFEHVLSVEPTNFIVAGSGGQEQLTVMSKRNTHINGEFDQEEHISYLLSTEADWITINENTITIAGNPSDTIVREATLIITQDIVGGKTIEIPILQGIGVVEYEYELTASPDNLSFINTGETKAFTVTSTKQKKINGVANGEKESVETNAFVNGVGYSVSDNQVTAIENQSEGVRTGTLTVTQVESNKRVIISLSQAAGVVTWVYALSLSPASLSFAGGGETKGFTVTSTKQKKINGKNAGIALDVSFVSSCNGTGFSTSSNNVHAAANQSETVRNGTLTITQAESGKTVEASLSQAAGVVTYEYALSVSPTSMSFVGGGETKGFNVVSNKQKKINGVDSGSAVAVATTPSCTGTGFKPSGNNVVAEANQAEASRTGTLTVTQAESGKTVDVPLSQAAGVVTWDYILSASPETLSFVSSGETKAFMVTSTKQKKINGVNMGGAETITHTPAASGTGFSVSGSNVIATSNQTEAARTGTLTVTQSESGKKVEVSLSQAAGTVTWDYTLSVSPTLLSFGSDGETKAFTVTSTKQKKINGVNAGSAETVAHTPSANGTGFSVSGSNVVASANLTEGVRTGTLTVTQVESGKTVDVSLNQAAGVVTWEYALSVSPSSLSFFDGGETKAFTVTSTKQKKINGVNSGSAESVNYVSAVSGTGFSVSGGSKVIAAANLTEFVRVGVLTVTQAESGKTVDVSLDQSAGKEYDLIVTVGYDNNDMNYPRNALFYANYSTPSSRLKNRDISFCVEGEFEYELQDGTIERYTFQTDPIYTSWMPCKDSTDESPEYWGGDRIVSANIKTHLDLSGYNIGIRIA